MKNENENRVLYVENETVQRIKFYCCDILNVIFLFLMICASPFLTGYAIILTAAKELNRSFPPEFFNQEDLPKVNWKITAVCSAATILYYLFWVAMILLVKKA